MPNRISVIMTVYNGLPYLAEQLDSIVEQLQPEDELIALDDGSTDGSVELLQKYQAAWPQIRLEQPEHVGVVQNFARGIEMAEGSIIVLSDQDDRWKPNKLQKLREVLSAENRPALVLHNARFTDSKGQEQEETLFHWRKAQIGFWRNLWKNSYMGCCMAFTADLRPYILPVPEVAMHDQWIGLMAERYGKVHLIPEELTLYRRHNRTVTVDKPQSLSVQLKQRFALLQAYQKRIRRRMTS